MAEQIDTVVIGGGQAGLSISYFLAQQGREHVVLEQALQAGNAWRNQRWDSFTLVTPNWSVRLPGAEYQGAAPDGFMTRSELVTYFEQYVERFELPVRYGVRATSVERSGTGYLVRTEDSTYQAANVVMATGLFQQPKLPAFSTGLSAEIRQLHSTEYRNPGGLPPGAVLVVGSAQSGCQIAEELYRSGRKVYLCVGSARQIPRRYRGKDIYWWANQIGFLDRTLSQLPSPRARFAGNPHLSGKDGGHTLNLHQFARDGVVLSGRLQGAEDGKIRLSPDLKESLALADKFEADFLKAIDDYAQKSALDVPPEVVPQLRDGYKAEEVRELDLKAAGISSVIWTMGYRFDFSLVRLPIFDDDGFPLQKRGVTDYPGLYFMGLPWMPNQRSGLLIGVTDHAAHVASAIASRETGLPSFGSSR